jgi:hypothetical protein
MPREHEQLPPGPDLAAGQRRRARFAKGAIDKRVLFPGGENGNHRSRRRPAVRRPRARSAGDHRHAAWPGRFRRRGSRADRET